MKNNKGFSLVELIVVIAIMAILAAVAVVGVSIYVPKAKQANDKQMVSDVEYALNLYYQQNLLVQQKQQPYDQHLLFLQANHLHLLDYGKAYFYVFLLRFVSVKSWIFEK